MANGKETDDTSTMYISGVDKLERAIVVKFLSKNGLKMRHMVEIFARFVLKRSRWDSIRAGGAKGMDILEEHFLSWIEEKEKEGKVEKELLERYKKASIIEWKYQLKPVTRTDLLEIIEELKAGKEIEINGNSKKEKEKGEK